MRERTDREPAESPVATADPPPRSIDGSGDAGAAPTTRPTQDPGSGDSSRPWLRGVSLAVGVVVAACSSWWQLGRRPLWIDEAISLGATNQLGRTIRDTGGTMALYYVLLDGWTALVGTSPVALRTLSLVLALAALVVAAAVFHRVLPGPEAAVATVVTAALPGVVRMAQDARAYALLSLVVAGCWWCLARGVEAAHDPEARDSVARRWLLALVPLALAGVASQGLFLLHLVPVVASVVVLPRRRWLLTALVPATVAGLGATVVLLAIGADDVGDWIPPLSAEQAGAAARTLVGGPGWVVAVVGVLAAVGVVVALRGTSGDPLARWRALVPVWWALVPCAGLLVLSTVRPTFLGRYLLPSLPAVGALVAVALGASWRSALSAPRSTDGRGHEPDPIPAARIPSRPRDQNGEDRPSTAFLGVRTDGRSERALGIRTDGRSDGSPAGTGRGVHVGRVAGAVAVTGLLVAALVAGRVERGRTGYEDWAAVAAFIAAEARPGDGLIFPHATDQAHRDTVRAPFEAAWARVDDPAVVPVALSPARPLGDVRRFDDLTDPDELAEAMVDHPRVWAVEFPAFHASLKDLMTVEPAASTFRNVGVTTFGGGIQVVLLERVPA